MLKSLSFDLRSHVLAAIDAGLSCLGHFQFFRTCSPHPYKRCPYPYPVRVTRPDLPA
jgi:hypothetical protein